MQLLQAVRGVVILQLILPHVSHPLASYQLTDVHDMSADSVQRTVHIHVQT